MLTVQTSTEFPYTLPNALKANRTSLLVPWQLPEFVRDNPNYQNYVLFLEAYYEWLHQEGNVGLGSRGIPDFVDIDNTLNRFIQNFLDSYLAFFPTGSLIDERKLIKLAKELYQAKGTPKAFEFLFRVLYNSDVSLYNTKDFVFEPSSGKWLTTKSIKLNTIDRNWLQTINYKVFGETSKAYALIEDVIITDKNIKLLVSNDEGVFAPGEFVHVVDVHGKPLYIDGELLKAPRILGLLSGVKVDRKNRGIGYSVGDPVVFYGGLDPSVKYPIGAAGYISSVTSATLKGVTPVEPGVGYSAGYLTQVILSSPVGAGASSILTKLHNVPYYISLVPTDTIGPKANVFINDSSYNFANLISANANTSLIEAFTFPLETTYGIDEVDVITTGSGYDGTTIAEALGYYISDVPEDPRPFENMGMLPPLKIVDGGQNYSVGDEIVFIGGSGYGAHAIVTEVDTRYKAITGIQFIPDPTGSTIYPLGGMGYSFEYPTIGVNSLTGSGAIIEVTGLVGNNAKLDVSSTAYGQVLEIALTSLGENYVESPKVSLRVEDTLILNQSHTPLKGDIVYQGNVNSPTYSATVDSFFQYGFGVISLRTFNYDGFLDVNSPINLLRGTNTIATSLRVYQETEGIYTLGRKIYGNGLARAKANFSTGITENEGIYQNQDGHPSAYGILENKVYNQYTYLLQVEKALYDYKNAVFEFLHPAGLNYNTFNLLKNQTKYNVDVDHSNLLKSSLQYLANNYSFVANIDANTSNTVNFSDLNGTVLTDLIVANSYLTFYTKDNNSFTSMIKEVTTDTVILESDWQTTMENVAVATATANSDIINISTLTDSWFIATGNTVKYFSDFMRTYDYVSFDGINFKMITHVDEPITAGDVTIKPKTIRIDGAYNSSQSGHLTFKQNVMTSNIWVSSLNN